MHGSLDQPPIEVRPSRTTSFLCLLAAIGFVAIDVLLLEYPTQSRAMIWLGIIFFGAGIPLLAMRLVFPDTLILGPDGMTWRNRFRSNHSRWDDAQDFPAYAPSRRISSKAVGFDFTPGYRAISSGLRQTTKTLTGVQGSIGGGWEIGAAELADLLNSARARWAAGSPTYIALSRERPLPPLIIENPGS